MKKRILLVTLAMSVLFELLAVHARADLTVIGHATYLGGDPNMKTPTGDTPATNTTYQIIYEIDPNFGPIAWLDFSNSGSDEATQAQWVASLNNPAYFSYTLNPGYALAVNGWKLPLTKTASRLYSTSEMGNLFYHELKNTGFDGGPPTPPNPSINTAPFKNLLARRYWSATPGSTQDYYYFFDMADGLQSSVNGSSVTSNLGLAVCPVVPPAPAHLDLSR